MKFYIFKDVYENFQKLSYTNFYDYIISTGFELKKLDESKFNKNNTRDFLFENVCFSEFSDYLVYYGQKKNGPYVTTSPMNAIIDSAYEMKNEYDKQEYEKWNQINNKLLFIMQNAPGDVTNAIDSVINYCKVENMNPLYLLLFFYAYLKTLGEINK